jgi:Nif-specific regulatory protein
VQQATIRAAAQSLSQVQSSHLFREGVDTSSSAVEPHSNDADHGTFQDETRGFQKQLLARALHAADWNVPTAARRLDLTRGHVYALIKAFGLARER